jgi:outer membrane protein OmpA-like peptidoglycan-associated protein
MLNSRTTSRIRFTACVLLGIVCVHPAIGAHAESTQLNVPLCAGLTLVTAISQRDGDYESIKSIESIGSQDLVLKYSSEMLEDSVTKKLTVRRKLRLVDLASATLYMHHFNNKAPTTIPGTTALGASSTVLRSLKSSGETQFGIFESVGASAPVDRRTHPNVYDYQMVETVRRVGSAPVMLPVTVNDTATKLPAIHARGDYFGDKAEFFFLDDDENPIALKYRIGRDTLDVVKISFRCAAETATRVSRLEQSLLATGRADVYSIYFSFNSDELREESAPTIDEIAEVMRRHPEWKLAIHGHTDSVASHSYNLNLSGRRAMAVRNALVTTKGIAATRLISAGFGESRPRDHNDTLEGRARNRRVELVRLP